MIRKALITLLMSTVLSACGHMPGLTGPGSAAYLPHDAQGYGNPYTESYAQQYPESFGQESFGSDAYGTHGGFESTSPYGSSSGAAFPDPGYPETGFGGPEAFSGNFPTAPAASANPSPQAERDRAPAPQAVARPAPRSAKISLLSFNIWALPGFLGVDRNARIQALGETLKAYDLVALQEAFTEDVTQLKTLAGFQHHVKPPRNSSFKMNSGLYVLSRFPVLKTEFRAFGRCTGKDCLVNKGVLLVRVSHPELGPLDLYTTHFQSGQSESSEKIRAEDNNQQLETLLNQNLGPFPVILAGDFNFHPDQLAYRDLNSRFPLMDTFRAKHPDQAGFTVDPSNPYAPESTPGRNDFVFALQRENHDIQVLQSEVRYREPHRGQQLSDQYALSTELHITVTPLAVHR